MTTGLAAPALLFCPADRLDRHAKAAAAADTVILDLEDAVLPDAKHEARRILAASELDPARTIVRVNPAPSGLLELDLRAVRSAGYRTVMLAKAESVADLDTLGDFEVVAICESPRGIRNADELAASEPVVGLTWGAEDLVAALGGSSSRFPDGTYRPFAHHARARVLIAAGAEGRLAYDTAHLSITDREGLRAQAEDAAASGFAGMLCIHPAQVETVRDAFRPSPVRLAWSQAVLEAAESAGSGVFVFEGRMIDEPILRQARAVVRAS